MLVLVFLAGLGVYGHRTDWKLPKFAALVGAPPVDGTTGARNMPCPNRSA